MNLVGFTSSGLSQTNWAGFHEDLPERLDRLIGELRMPPVVVAFPDCFTRLGGNQYINSASMGAREDFLLHQMLPAIEQRFGCGGPGRSGVFGKSSGGYGTSTHALRHSDIWAAAACHSGDMGFELCYLPDMPAVLRAIAGAENSIERWWQQLEAARKHPEGSVKVINALAMAASYDPDPTQFLGIRLPVTFDTCEIIEDRWANWLRQIWHLHGFAGRIRGHGHLVMGAEAILASALGAATFDQLKYTEKTNGKSTPPAITSFSPACSGASSVRK